MSAPSPDVMTRLHGLRGAYIREAGEPPRFLYLTVADAWELNLDTAGWLSWGQREQDAGLSNHPRFHGALCYVWPYAVSMFTGGIWRG
jgi:hypothetical protein